MKSRQMGFKKRSVSDVNTAVLFQISNLKGLKRYFSQLTQTRFKHQFSWMTEVSDFEIACDYQFTNARWINMTFIWMKIRISTRGLYRLTLWLQISWLNLCRIDHFWFGSVQDWQHIIRKKITLIVNLEFTFKSSKSHLIELVFMWYQEWPSKLWLDEGQMSVVIQAKGFPLTCPPCLKHSHFSGCCAIDFEDN